MIRFIVGLLCRWELREEERKEEEYTSGREFAQLGMRGRWQEGDEMADSALTPVGRQAAGVSSLEWIARLPTPNSHRPPPDVSRDLTDRHDSHGAYLSYMAS